MSPRLITFFVFGLIVSCFPPPPPPKPDYIALNSGFMEMRRQFESCRSYCYFVAPQTVCGARLIAPHDALTMIHASVNTKDESAEDAIGCAGLSVKLGLEGLRKDLDRLNIEEPNALTDAMILGNWASQWAKPSCDPYHPTVRVVMVEDSRIPRVEPDYPR